ncbi:MAG: exo-alpha-sialidase, partial [Lentisphaeria bacterium]|nr:exo-alpha-sialidase [Lentisphaeria bacterium]
FPPHLLKLHDGRLLMSYGYRRKPFGNRCRISCDEGESWSEPLILSDDGAVHDLGYPSTAELADGTLVTAWYENSPEKGTALLRCAHWRLND